MANNTTVNKVVINNNTVLDLTDTTATSDKVLDGEVFYTASGSRTVGTYVDQDTTDLTQMTGILPISLGGTNATNANDARTNLGIGSDDVGGVTTSSIPTGNSYSYTFTSSRTYLIIASHPGHDEMCGVYLVVGSTSALRYITVGVGASESQMKLTPSVSGSTFTLSNSGAGTLRVSALRVY